MFIIFYQGKPLVAKKFIKKYKLFGSAPYSGLSSSINPSCSRTELNRYYSFCLVSTKPWPLNIEVDENEITGCNRLKILLLFLIALGSINPEGQKLEKMLERVQYCYYYFFRILKPSVSMFRGRFEKIRENEKAGYV